jgi:hypothetical protein
VSGSDEVASGSAGSVWPGLRVYPGDMVPPHVNYGQARASERDSREQQQLWHMRPPYTRMALSTVLLLCFYFEKNWLMVS